MDHHRFDRLTRSLATGIGRRRLTAALAAALLGPAFAAGPAVAACKNPGRKCDRNSDCCAHATCKQDKCACKNGFDECGNDCVKLDNDEDHCGQCGNRCQAGETCQDGDCVGPCGGLTCDSTQECVDDTCTTPPGGCAPGADDCASNTDVPCGDQPNCSCNQTTEGVTVCAGPPIPGVSCGSCATSADCAEFGPDAFCAASTNTDVCCGPSARNACKLPCPA